MKLIYDVMQALHQSIELKKKDGLNAIIVASICQNHYNVCKRVMRFNDSCFALPLISKRNSNSKMRGGTMKEETFLSAAETGDIKTIETLLSDGVNVDTHDEHSRTALMKASKHNHIDVVRLLIENGADINARDNRGTNPIYWAASKGNLEITKLLMENGADITVHDDRGWTALDHAKANHHLSVARFLEEQSAAV